MKILFYGAVLGLGLFEILKIYLIMPFPGSQVLDTIDLAYFLHEGQWFIRVCFLVLIIVTIKTVFQTPLSKLTTLLTLISLLTLIFVTNFKMQADAIFEEPNSISFQNRDNYDGNDSTVVVVVSKFGLAKAYPIRYLIYHHQIRDSIAGKAIMVTYCSVCRTGRIFEPKINDKEVTFRLVGMDKFNAMFEDADSGSWWQQATGEAIVGPLKGKKLNEIESLQMSAADFFKLYSNGEIMKADPYFINEYDLEGAFEKGKSKGALTLTDPISWNDKSWVIGISLNNISKAYDWNELKKKRIIVDEIGSKNVVIILSNDGNGFVAFEKPNTHEMFIWESDTLRLGEGRFTFTGKSLNPLFSSLVLIPAYQEFWHSWQTFHPNSKVFPNSEID